MRWQGRKQSDNIEDRRGGASVARQRVKWFKVGFKGGRMADCDTFAGR